MTLAARPVTLAPLCPDDWWQRRSGMSWLVGDGESCRPGQTLARCNYAFRPPTREHGWPGVKDTFQIVIVAAQAGVVRHEFGASRGGWQDRIEYFHYVPGQVIGNLIPEQAPARPADGPANHCLLLTNTRMTTLLSDRESLSSGWHFLQRGWIMRQGAPKRTLLGLGICEVPHILRGEDYSFSELLALIDCPVQLVVRTDVPVVATARIALQQLQMTEEQAALIWQDIQAGLMAMGAAATPDDWIAAAGLGQALTDGTIRQGSHALSPAGITALPPAGAVIMSMLAEDPVQLRHRRLGYHMRIHEYVFQKLPEAFWYWIKSNFEQVTVSLAEVEQDYSRLCEALSREGRTLFLLNAVSSRRGEDIQKYCYFPGPLEERFASVRNLSLNLMAAGLADATGLRVIDTDALAAELGISRSTTDGIHHSRLLEHALRQEIARLAMEEWAPAPVAA